MPSNSLFEYLDILQKFSFDSLQGLLSAESKQKTPGLDGCGCGCGGCVGSTAV